MGHHDLRFLQGSVTFTTVAPHTITLQGIIEDIHILTEVGK